MRITIKDNLPGHCGSITHDADIEPIRLELTADDKANIANMAQDKTDSILFFPDDWTLEQSRNHFSSMKVNSGGLPESRCREVISAIEMGSLDAAVAMLKEGIPENTSLPADYKQRLESEGTQPQAGQEPVT